MLRAVVIVALFLTACSQRRMVERPSWPGLMAGQTVYSRLVSDQQEISEAHPGKNKVVASRAFDATELAWEAYNHNPTTDRWNSLQTIGSQLDEALRNLRGEHTGNPGVSPPCVTGEESWCRREREGF